MSKHNFTLVVIASIHIALIEVTSIVDPLVIRAQVSSSIVVQACTCRTMNTKVARAAWHALDLGWSALMYCMHLGKSAAASQVIPPTVVVITRVVHSLIVIALHAIRPLPL